MRSVTKATPIQFIDSKTHLKKQRSRKTTLSGYYSCLSRDLLLMPLGVDTHKHTPTFTDETISINQAHNGMPPTQLWFNYVGARKLNYYNTLPLQLRICNDVKGSHMKRDSSLRNA